MNPTRAPQKILIRAPNWIGDQILAYPCFQYLRAGYPSRTDHGRVSALGRVGAISSSGR